MKTSIRSVAVIGALALLLAACGSTAGEGADGSTTTTASNGTTTTSSTTAPSIVVASPQDLLDRFASLWIEGDWAGMADIAEPGVVATAEESGQAEIANVVWVPSCELDSSGSGSCELLFSPPDYDGYALIFSARYTQGSGGELSIVELIFGGDAG
jgi:hypothetical protein